MLSGQLQSATRISRVDILDYGVPSRYRPSMRKVTYAELRSGTVELNGEEVRTSSLSSFRRARKVARELKDWVESGKMDLALPTRADRSRKSRHSRCTRAQQGPRVLDIMDRPVISIGEDEEITTAAKKLLKGETNHLPVINGNRAYWSGSSPPSMSPKQWQTPARPTW